MGALDVGGLFVLGIDETVDENEIVFVNGPLVASTVVLLGNNVGVVEGCTGCLLVETTTTLEDGCAVDNFSVVE